MNTTETLANIDALLVQRTWLRRLATALTSDPTTAEDLTQETWLAALTSPPRTAARTWLRRVFLSRLYDGGRAQQRRQQREQAATQAAVEQVATPEELTARMELHRRLAGYMTALDEDLRQVLFLRYVEDLEPIEVARRLGIPDGTARWRLKRGLDELRTRLDADAGGDRRRWLPLLSPLATPKQPAAPAPRSFTWPAQLATIAAVCTVALFIAQWRCSNTQVTHTGQAENGLAVAPAAREPPAEGQATMASAPGPTAAAPVPACPEVQALEKERDALAAATEAIRTPPKEVFLKGSPNTAVEKRFIASVDEMMTKPGKCGHSFACRGLVCRLSLVVPESMYKEKGAPLDECFDPVLRESLKPRVLGQQVDYGGATFDPVSRTSLGKFDLYFRLANERADPATAEERRLPKLPPGWERERGPISAKLSPLCQGRIMRVRRELAELTRQITRSLPLPNVFEQSAARPELARELAGGLRPHLASAGKPLPMEIECRGSVCALRPREGDPGSAIHWTCPKDVKPGELCLASVDDDGWFARLRRKQSQLSFLERVDPPWQRNGEITPAFVSLRPRDEQRGIAGERWVLSLARTLDFAGLVAACERRFPAKGTLTVLAKVPETCGLAVKPGGPQLSVEYGGELMGSELAACLRSGTEQALARVEAPGCTYAWGHEWRLDFPNPKVEISEPAE
jgi:RNA polymerase sigma factor (sigma-70 family)